MIITRIIASFRKQGEINVSRTVLPAPVTPVMSCTGAGGISLSHLSVISVCPWAMEAVVPACEPSTRAMSEGHRVTPMSCRLCRADAWEPQGTAQGHVSSRCRPLAASAPRCAGGGCAEAAQERLLGRLWCSAILTLCHWCFACQEMFCKLLRATG